ncbi:hypothetical protein BSZ39_08580 [Bowdeniella nasicola]|uniref:Nickel import system ATP-binding protein NikD n=1 Tax=Bowdeniella nasicola TaxID=208480 RepID=A0A1Q5Q1Y2_9ACTO|nr:ATP-binding cassette domain-containing protein [Bowdeniella nasicola]OKL53600.1 hypothetical protein BSZ39_08580 [Bowdeniella nasicola]
MTILNVEKLGVTFHQYDRRGRPIEIPALHDVSLSAARGELLAVVGASGSGKSLLAHAILGVLPPNATVSGRMTLEGYELTGAWLETVRGRQLRLIPQSVTHLDPSMTVGQQLRLGPRRLTRTRVLELLNDVELSCQTYDRYPHELSGGMLRRILLATCFGDDVRVVIADEPTPGIHPEALEEVVSQLLRLRDNGVTVVLITHDMVLAMRIADRLVVFRGGQSLDSFAPWQLLNRPASCHPYAQQLWRAQPAHDFWDAV